MVAAGAGVLGGVLAFFWAPGVRARSAVQHFAAGVVIAAAASELIPEVERIGTPFGILGGFGAGGLVMIGLKWLVLKFEKREKKRGKLPVGLAAAAAVDTLIDGVIISSSAPSSPSPSPSSSSSSRSRSARSSTRRGRAAGTAWQ